MSTSLAAGRLQELAGINTFADTLAPRMVSETTLAQARAHVDRIVLVNDAQILQAMRWLWQEANQLVEPAGAASIAAMQSGLVDVRGFAHPVALICGGNAAAEPVFAAYQSIAKA
jgi:threonine dehydratase